MRLLCLVRESNGDRNNAQKRVLSAVCDACGHELHPDQSERIVAVCGDLAKTRLGMTQSEYDELAAATDTIIHSGALVDHVKPYAWHKQINVIGTTRVLEFAAAGGVTSAVHFISTSNVALTSNKAVILEDDPLEIG